MYEYKFPKFFFLKESHSQQVYCFFLLSVAIKYIKILLISQGASLQDDEENNENINNNNAFIKQQKMHIKVEKKLLNNKQVPGSQIKDNENLNKFNKGSNATASLKLEELDFKPWCNITTKEAVSAIHRAKTQQCKKELVQVICSLQKGLLFPKQLTTFCPAPGK